MVVPGAGRVPVVPDEVLSAALGSHPRFHQAVPGLRPLAINRLAGGIVQGEQPAGDEVLFVGGIGKPFDPAPGIAVGPAAGGGGKAEAGHHPQAPVLDRSPAAARVPFRKDLRPAVVRRPGVGAAPNSSARAGGHWVLISGCHQGQRAQAHRFAEEAVGDDGLLGAAVGDALRPPDEAIRFLEPALDPGIRPVGEQSDPFLDPAACPAGCSG